VFPSFPPDDLIRRYASLPLIFQPGERWLYNAGSEILGVLIARLAGTTFGEFLSERIFLPLGMKDTAFYAPKDKHHRFATAYIHDSAVRQLKVFDPPVTGRFSAPPVFENGAAGLVSTVDDFNAFAQMMLNGGSLGSVRVLSPESVALMTTNHIMVDEKRESQLFLGSTRGVGIWPIRFHRVRRSASRARTVRLGWWLRNVLVFGSADATHRHFAGPADHGFAKTAAGIHGFLDHAERSLGGLSPQMAIPDRYYLRNNFTGHVGAAKGCSSYPRAPACPGPSKPKRRVRCDS
jgi:CubicO group peptidase (beta-lactamase class C family)